MADYPINVRLSRSDLAKADQASALRYQLARAAGVKDRLIDTSRGGDQTDLPGLKAEIAVAKLLGIEFEPTALGIDNGCDLYVNVGQYEIAIQVKSCHNPQSKWMLGTPHAKANWDIAIFVLPTDNHEVMQVYGWLPMKIYKLKEETVDLGHGPGPGVKIENLIDMEQLWRMISMRRSA
mgnify:CR=1 FL=1